MPNIRARRLINPTKEELDTCAEVYKQAFVPGPTVRAMTADNLDYAFDLHRSIAAATILGGGELWVASYDDKDIVGVAAWFPPGSALFSNNEQKEQGYNQLMRRYPPELEKWVNGYFFPTFAAHTDRCLGEGTVLSAMHLQWLGVLPEFQGRGVGRILDKAKEAEGQKVGMTVQTDLPRNVEIYSHWGYKVVGEKDDYDTLLGDKFTMWILAKYLPETS